MDPIGLRMAGSGVVDAFIGLFGLARAKLGEWPALGVAATAIAVIKENGGQYLSETGSPDGRFDVLRFRVRGRRMRLCREELGEVTLWGPKQLVSDLSQQVATKLAEAETGR
jgi:hypothetical protein